MSDPALSTTTIKTEPTAAPSPAPAPAPVPQHAEFILPPSIVSRVDLSRMMSELEWLDNELTALAIRNQTATQAQTPVMSQALRDFATLNKLQLNESKARSAVIAQLRVLKNKAPVVHMTFAVSADRESLQQLTAWVRQEVHPQALIVVGLQPSLVAGVYVRTPNHVHDFSLRAMLDGRHDLLIKELETLRAGR